MTIQNIPCKLIKRMGKKAEIEIDGQIVTISSDHLPVATGDGDELSLCFLTQKEAKIKEENLAKLILEEILNGK